MPPLLLYLLKANVALVLFYLAYHLVLRKLTFYHLNRLFLVFGIVFSSVYPLVDLTELFSRHQDLAAMQNYAVFIPAYAPAAIPEQAPAFDYWLIPVGLFWLGCGLMLLRLIVQFVSLYKIHRASVPTSYQGVDFRKVQGISEAFSFWQTIYLNPAQHQSPEMESILRHEQIHVNGWHTLDVLLAELSTVFYWFNPGVWLMKKAMKENLEFIADQHVVNAVVDRVAYQYLLLKVVGATQPQIANQFNFPSLKRRIAMMNKMPTKKANRLRILVVLPLSAALLVAFQNAPQPDPVASPEVQTSHVANESLTATEQQQPKANNDLPKEPLYFIDGKEASREEAQQLATQEIHSVHVVKGKQAVKSFGKKGEKGVIIYITEKNKDSKAVQELNKRITVSETPDDKNTPLPSNNDGEESYTYVLGVTDAYYKNEANLPDDHKNFLKRNPAVRHVGYKFNNRKDFDLLSFVVYLKSGKTEVYDYNRSPRIPAAEAKYGSLPSLPPPPPPVRTSQN